ncbi:MAG: bifunctional nuclease family protein [FCB group bacterium]|nr:bifunctional nuclease family protein [FCB group bacterium]
MLEVEVIRISYNNPDRGYAITLKDIGSERILPIIVGATEAQAIALAFEGVEMPRPLTHDLLVDVITALDSDVTRVLITHLSKGTYFAKIVLQHEQDGEITIDSRPSDAIAVGLRMNAPIFASETLLNGITETKSKAHEPIDTPADDSAVEETLKNLQNILQIAIEEENYEVAAKIRDRISYLAKN